MVPTLMLVEDQKKNKSLLQNSIPPINSQKLSQIKPDTGQSAMLFNSPKTPISKTTVPMDTFTTTDKTDKLLNHISLSQNSTHSNNNLKPLPLNHLGERVVHLNPHGRPVLKSNAEGTETFAFADKNCSYQIQEQLPPLNKPTIQSTFLTNHSAIQTSNNSHNLNHDKNNISTYDKSEDTISAMTHSDSVDMTFASDNGDEENNKNATHNEETNITWTSMNGDEENYQEPDIPGNSDNLTEEPTVSKHMNIGSHQEIEDIKIDSNQILDMNFFFNQIHENFDIHGEQNCEGHIKNLRIVKILNWGLRSRITFKCLKCGYEDAVWTTPKEPSVGIQLNRTAVAGTLTSGIGYSTLREILASLNIKCMSEVTYILHRDSITKIIETMSTSEMQKAALEEIELAIEAGDVTPDGTPFTQVIIDDVWSKRTYRNGKYDALSGVGIIIGVRTGKVLWCGVKNKMCATCSRAEREGREPKFHICYKNWGRDEPSTGMETRIIAEGFINSVNNADKRYNLIYSTIIADGDSCVYNTITTIDVYKEYGITVQKIECSNHLYRNFCKHIYDASKSRITDPPTTCNITHLRERVEKSGYVMQKYVEKAVEKWNDTTFTFNGKVTGLGQDIKNMPFHIFGDHDDCTPGDEACKEYPINYIPVLRSNGILYTIELAVGRLQENADSLLQVLTNNPAELCNSILNKEVGGKRKNFCCKNSYYLRALCAAVQFMSQDVLSKIMQYSGTQTPTVITELERCRQDRNLRVHIHRISYGKRKHSSGKGTDKHYGPLSYLCGKPDLDPKKFEDAKNQLRIDMEKNQKYRADIESRTRDQRKCPEWREKRRRLITASHFGIICRQKSFTSCANEVKAIRRTDSIKSAGMTFGITHESKAMDELRNVVAETIEPCRLFIDPEFEMLACSPDGRIEELNAIVEVKCLYTGRNLLPKVAIKNVASYSRIFKDKNQPTTMNEKHHYYYQVQGQLHITRSSFCYFVVYTLKGIHYIKVERDTEFWEKEMEPKLLSFWEEALLPEVIDSRLARGMEIRERERVLLAIENKKKTNSDRKIGI